MTMLYSPRNNCFIPPDMIDSYDSSFLEDVREVGDDTWREFSENRRGQTRTCGADGMPVWADIVKTPVDYEQEKQRLIKEASSKIQVLSDERDAGIISDDDLNRWKAWIVYRKALRELDVTADGIEWPDKPE